MRRERDSFTQLLSIWTFCRILYFLKDKDLFPPLMRWFNDFNKALFFEYDKYSIYHNKSAPIFHEDYWKYATRMAVLGQHDQLVDLLGHTLKRTSSNRLTARIEELYKLIEGKEGRRFDKNGLKEIKAKTEKLGAKNETTQLQINNLLSLIHILMGDEGTIWRHTKDDLHAFICIFYYKGEDSINFSTAASDFYKRYPTETKTVYEHLLKKRFDEALELCAVNDWWLLCHMPNLFSEMKGAFSKMMAIETKKKEAPFLVPLKNHTRLYYASALLNTFGLWKEAFTYMLQCEDLGKDVIQEHMRTIDISKLDDEKMDDYVQFCQDHSIRSIGDELCMRKASYLLSIRDFKGALTYYSKANAYQQVDSVFEEILSDYVKQGTTIDLQALSNQFSGFHHTLYSLLWSMNQYLSQLDITQAAEAYKKLIRLDPIPMRLIPIVLWEGLRIIEGYVHIVKLNTQEVEVIKRLWSTISKNDDPVTYELFYYYIQKDKDGLVQPTVEALAQCARQFLDATSLRYSVAFSKAGC
ncbi:nucleoporin Nup85-like protein [Mycotypha africana]|uniref:nucleoporin Nup85-like protein n=1 Tax=Mycotypha africana TaxID=64632 RepID=UPI002300B5DD|nr:nucleoporin Nup85-like protein [Mycotypha africana]KAI8987999.1 nucleoporin Nup85-like protein [Mycotypha africana]